MFATVTLPRRMDIICCVEKGGLMVETPDTPQGRSTSVLPLCDDAYTLFDHLVPFVWVDRPEVTGGREWPFMGLFAEEGAGDTYLIMTQLASFLGVPICEPNEPVKPDSDLCVRVTRSGRTWLECGSRVVVEMDPLEGHDAIYRDWLSCATLTGSALLIIGYPQLPDDMELTDFIAQLRKRESCVTVSVPVKQVW